MLIFHISCSMQCSTHTTFVIHRPRLKHSSRADYAADAQVGNWLSWQDVTWSVEGRTISGPDLLKRTILYKVGHHASQNATLNEGGLELMTALELALVPTDAKMAEKVKWGTLPWKPLISCLNTARLNDASGMLPLTPIS